MIHKYSFLEINRLDWIDTARGIGIILVVLGHTFLPKPLASIIYSFHMPLFFFLSGYLFAYAKQMHETDFVSFIKKRVKTLILPYIVFSLFTYSYWLMTEKLIIYKSNLSPYTPLEVIATSIGINEYTNGALWFLTCLFIVEIFFFVLISFIKRENARIIILMLSAGLGYICSVFGNTFRIIWNIDVAFTATIFYSIGYYYRIYGKNVSTSNILNIFLMIFVVVITVLIALANGKISMAGLLYNNYIYFCIGAVSGITAVVMFSKIYSQSKVLTYLGKNSIIILCTHMIIFNILDWLQYHILFGIPYLSMKGSLFAGGIYTSIIMVFSVPIIFLTNRYFPFLIGRSSAN